MNNLSERVQREFNEWKERYDIPYNMEFQVKTLLKLQEEYETVEIGSNTTKTRETLLHMIQDLQGRMNLNEKNENAFKAIYVDYFKNDANGISKVEKAVVYCDNFIYNLQGEKYKSIKDYAYIIHKIALSKRAIVYIDVRGMGMALYDELKEFKNIVVNELHHLNDFMW